MIPDGPVLGVFVVASLALLLVPGPAVLYIVVGTVHVGLGVTTAFAGSVES